MFYYPYASNRTAADFAEPRIHAFVYQPSTGELQRLPVDFKDYMKDLGEVYDLYHLEGAPAN
jgi:hypothetical protein